MVMPREIHMERSKGPFFFLIEQGKPPKKFFSYDDFIGHLRQLGIASYIDFLPLNLIYESDIMKN